MTGRKTLHDANSELLNAHKIVIDSKCNGRYPDPGNAGKVKKKIYIPVHSNVLNFGHCTPRFLPITLHMKVALLQIYLFVACAKPFPTKQNVKYECLHCAFKIFH